jgi:hypothetical protein
MLDFPSIQEQIQWLDSAIEDEKRELSTPDDFSHLAGLEDDIFNPTPERPSKVGGNPAWPKPRPPITPPVTNIAGNPDWVGKKG